MKETAIKINKPDMIVIAFCFLLTSTGYLAWTYNVMGITAPVKAQVISLVAGYLFQAAGIILSALFLRSREKLSEYSMYIMLFLHMLCLVPAALSQSYLQILVFGFLMNLICGWIAGYYLYRLAAAANKECTAVTLGIGYGMSIIASWILSLLQGSLVHYTYCVLIVCLILTVISIFLIRKMPAMRREDNFPKSEDTEISQPVLKLPKQFDMKYLLLISGCMVLLFSMINSCGFGFSTADLQGEISIEFSRLFYAAGLIIAGILSDRNRKYGLICALAALVFPFIILALQGEQVSLIIFWSLSYFAFGFYTVYRIILFVDIASATKMLWLAGFGLMIGRMGDAAGELLSILLSDRVPVLVAITAVLFFAAVFLFFRIYHWLYQPETERRRSEQEIFNYFSARHDLSARERDVLRLLLQEMTNIQIAEELSVSESTVKFHVHNILQKTGCKNRVALLSIYSESRSQ